MTPEECRQLAESVLERIGAGEAEVTVTEQDEALTRFAHNAIHQNVASTSTTVRLRLIHEGRVGVAERRGGIDERAIAELAVAADAARRVMPAGEPAPLPDSGDLADVDPDLGWDAGTAASSPEERADRTGTLTRAAAAAGMEAFGTCYARARQVAMASTRGLRRSHHATAAGMTLVVRGADGSGYGDRHAVAAADLDAAALAAEAVGIAARNQRAVTADPGEYAVVLGPYAVAEMLDHLAYMALSALPVQEKRSGIRLGEKQMSDLVTIADEPLNPDAAPFPFDWEGVRTRTVTMVDRGVSSAVVYDTPTAIVDGVASTGHSLPQPNTWGPLPAHLTMAPGGAGLDELVAATGRGLYVNRFWYVRDVHPLRTIITGMTREGTFLIEDGRIGRPVRDLRFTESILDALATVEGVGSDRRLEIGEWGTSVLAPALHVGRFTFTS